MSSAKPTLMKVTATCAVAMVMVCGPAALPAWADNNTTTTNPIGAPPVPAWQPPAVDWGLLPGDGNPTTNGVTYQQKYQCVQPNLGNTTVTDQPMAQSMLNIKQAQQLSTGKGVTVAVIDTGVNPHPYLGTRLRGIGDYVDPTKGNGAVDCDGHGTLTAGIIGANTAGQNVGFTGVAPDVNIDAIRQTSQVYTYTSPLNNQTLTAGTLITLAQAIRHAADTPGVGVITTSIDECIPATQAASAMTDPTSGAPQIEAAVAYAASKNIVVINSAGNQPSSSDNNGQGGQGGQQQQQGPCAAVPQNDSPDPNAVKQVELPAAYSDYVLSVASVSPADGSVSSFSEWGPWVGVAAPGEDITSIDPGQGGTGLSDRYAEPGGSNAKLGPIQGTSFAAPYVAGLAALIRSRYPTMSAKDVIYRIEATAQHPSGPGGRNDQVGFGVIDPVAALTAVIPGQNGVPQAGSISIPANLSAGAPSNWPATRIALIGSVIAAALLLVTMFVMRTVRHNRERQEPPSA